VLHCLTFDVESSLSASESTLADALHRE
jgi:hypothetical protein